MNIAVKFKENMKKIADRVDRIPKTQRVQLTVLMDDSFISIYTSFSSLVELQESFEKEYKKTFVPEILESKDWNTFISEKTKFSNWEEMYKKAGQLYLSKQVSKAFKG